MLRVFVSSPKIFSFFNIFEVQAYGLFFVMGLFCFLGLFLSDAAQKMQISKEKLFDAVMISLLAGIVGARVLYLCEFPEVLEQGFLQSLNPQAGGLSLLGGLLCAPIAAFVSCRLFKIPFVAFIDFASLYVPLFDFFGRLGCFFGGCCYGMPGKGFFSVIYLDGFSAPLNKDLIPIQFFTAAAFLCMFVLFHIFRRFFLEYPGLLTFLYFTGAGYIRFFTDFFRADRSLFIFSTNVAGLAISVTWYQIISLVLAIFSLVGVFVCCFFRAKKTLLLERL